ncbi:MAG: helix-hairpin-helix domain-containing protein, partial [Rhodothermales bacterium]
HIHLLATSRLDLNRADENDLLQIPGMSVRDAGHILAYRATTGRFREVDDLVAAGLSLEAVRAIRPFVEVAPIRSVRTKVELLQRWTRRLELSRGFKGDSSNYAGSPDTWSTRIRIRRGRSFRAAVTLEKDAGEPGLWPLPGSLYGYDFASGSVALDGAGPFRVLILGDYAVRVGEGMLLQQGISVGNVVGSSPLRSGNSLRPYSSSSEHGFFRGLALRTKDAYGISIAAFLSRRHLDGRTDSTGAIDILTSGYHRTQSERNAHRRIREDASGMILSLNREAVGAGIAAYSYRHTSDQASSYRSLTTGFVSFRSRSGLLSAEAARRGPSFSFSLTGEYEPLESAVVRLRWMSAEATSDHLHSGTATSGGAGRSERSRDAALSLRATPAVRLSVISRHRKYQSPRHDFELSASIAEMRIDYHPKNWLSLH